MPPVRHLRHLAAAAAAALLLGACGGAKAPADDSQIAARIDSGEISVHQVHHVLQREPRLAAEQPQAAARKVLESLVEQEIAAQAARKQGLDRDPAVLQALQVAQREVLARAWQDRLAAAASLPSSDEIDRWYDSHPALFAQRRLYTLQEAVVALAADRLEPVRAMAAEAKGAAQLIDALQSAGVRPAARQFVQAAEDLPFGLLEPMSKLSAGESLVVPVPGGARILSVVHVHAAPVERRQANEPIAAFIQSERRRIAVEQGMKPLRDAARVEYLGSFAQAVDAAASAAP